MSLRMSALVRWASATVLVVVAALVVAIYVRAGGVRSADAILLALVVTVAVATASVWWARLDLDDVRIRSRTLRRTRVVALADVARVVLPTPGSGVRSVGVFVDGRILPVLRVDLAYWERSSEVRTYFEALSARKRNSRRAQRTEPTLDDEACVREARKVLAIDRRGKVIALAVLAPIVAVPSFLAVSRGARWAVVPLVIVVALPVLAHRFGSAVPHRWFESTRTLRSGRACYAEILAVELRRHDIDTRPGGMRSDGRLEIDRTALTWTSRYGAARMSVDTDDIDHVLVGPASSTRWFLVVRTADGGHRTLYVADELAPQALAAVGIDVRDVPAG